MLKAPKVKKLENKCWSNLSSIFLVIGLATFLSSSILQADEKTDKPSNEKSTPKPTEVKLTPDSNTQPNENKKDAQNSSSATDKNLEKNHETDTKKITERLKTAQYDYDEKLFGQALGSFSKIIAEFENDLNSDDKKAIHIKMAHCHYELGQFYKSILLLDPIIGLDDIPLDFQPNNFHSTLISFQTLSSNLKKPKFNNMKPITVLFPELNNLDDMAIEKIIVTFNSILNTPYSCKKIIDAYLNNNTWNNKIINQIPSNGSEKEIKLLTRLILEELYPINSYLNNQKKKKSSNAKENEISVIKNQYYYDALYWRAQIHMETFYYSFARAGFEEVSGSLNFKENEKIISCLFYKSKANFYLNQYKLALKDLENLKDLYGIDEFYKNNFNEETIYYIARCHFELAKYDKAIQKFLLLTAGYENREPHSKLIRNAYFWLGETYYCKSLLNDAIKAYEVVLKYGTYSEKEKVLYSIGWALFEKGDLASKDASKKHFNLLLNDYPNTAFRLKTELKLAEIEIEEGNSERGEKIIDELKNTTMNDDFIVKNSNLIKQTDYLIGLLYIKKNEYKKAMVHFKRSEDTLDQNLRQKINIQFGICHKELGDFKKAIVSFTLASENDSNESLQISAKENLADTYLRRRSNQSDLELAAKLYDTLIKQNPNHSNNIDWRKKKSEILRLQKRDDEAIATLSKILKEDLSNWEEAQIEIGNILMSASPQRFKVAAAHYKAIIDTVSSKEKNEELILNYAICLLKSDQAVDAIRHLQRLINESENINIVTDAYQYLALCYENENDPQKSIAILNDSLTKYPQQKNRIHLHQECVRLNQLTQNIDLAKKHLNILYLEDTDQNNQAKALYQLAAYDLKSNEQNNLEMAIEKFKTIIEKFSNSSSSANASFQLGLIYINQKNVEEAKKHFEKIINAEQDTELMLSSFLTIGDFYYAANNFLEALKYYTKAIPLVNTSDLNKNKTQSETILSKKADCFFQLKNYFAAMKEYIQLIRMNRNDLDYKIRYAKCCIETKTQILDAISILEKIPAQNLSQEIEKLMEQLKTILAQEKKK